MEQGKLHICSENMNRKEGTNEKRRKWAANSIYAKRESMAGQLPQKTSPPVWSRMEATRLSCAAGRLNGRYWGLIREAGC